MAKIFEQSEVTTPDTSERLASGKVATPTSNITIANFVAWLQNTALSFLKPSSNLNDVADKPTARTNLEVYSTTEVDNELALKADNDNVLEKDNTTTFNPTSDYNPATKKSSEDAVDAKVGELVYSAFINDVSENDPNLTRVEWINKSFISNVATDVRTYEYTFNSAITDFQSKYEIITAPFLPTPTSSTRTPTVSPEGTSGFVVNFRDTSANAQLVRHWIRIYKWA